MTRAREYIEGGYRRVVDIGFARYFDTVNYDKLASLVARKIKDKRLLKLIRLYLESGVMVNSVVVEAEEGCPLSLLLSNIRLELEERGQKFCRYAIACNIYVESWRVGKRVVQSATGYLENMLNLTVNKEESAVGRP